MRHSRLDYTDPEVKMREREPITASVAIVLVVPRRTLHAE